MHWTIGLGKFGRVELASHLSTGYQVAIKVFDKDALAEERFRVEFELKAMKTLCHPHVLQLLEVS